MSRFNLFYFIKEGIKSIFLHGLMSFAAVAVIVACLLITGSFALIAYNIDAVINKVESSNEMLAFVDESLTDDQAKALSSEIRQIPNVADCVFISRDEALSNYSQELGADSVLLEGLEDEKVLRHRYRIILTDNSLMQETAARIQAIDGIAKVNADLEISESINSIKNAVHIVSYILRGFCLSCRR
jgi:cell division transport system permease protein